MTRYMKRATTFQPRSQGPLSLRHGNEVERCSRKSQFLLAGK